MSALKMPTHPVARIEPLRVASQKTTSSQPPESVAASPPPDFPSSNTHAPPPRLFAALPKRLQKPPPILVIQKNRLLAIASAHPMVNRRAYSNLDASPGKKPRRNFKICIVWDPFFAAAK